MEVFRVVELVGGPHDGKVIGQMMTPTTDMIFVRRMTAVPPYDSAKPEWVTSLEGVYVSAGRSSANGEVFEYRPG